MIPLQRTCKQVTALLVAREDRRLPWPDRLALRLHMRVCRACPRFEQQMLILRQGLGMWRNYTDSPESDDGTNTNLQKTLVR